MLPTVMINALTPVERNRTGPHACTLSTANLHDPDYDIINKSTPVGFEPTRGDPIGLGGRRLNRSAKVSLMLSSEYTL